MDFEIVWIEPIARRRDSPNHKVCFENSKCFNQFRMRSMILQKVNLKLKEKRPVEALVRKKNTISNSNKMYWIDLPIHQNTLVLNATLNPR